MKFSGPHTAGTNVPLGLPCPNSLKKNILFLLLALLSPLLNHIHAMSPNTIKPYSPSALTPGKHNTTEIHGCTGYNPAKLIFTTGPSGGTPPYTFQWQLNNSVIAGETSSSYDPPQLTAAGTYSYNCAITDADGSVVLSEPKIIMIVPDPYVTISGMTTTCQNNSLVLNSTIINGTGNYNYQWESSPSEAGPWTAISEAIFPEFSPPTDETGTQYYHLIIFPSVGSCNDARSGASSVTVNTLPKTSLIYHL